MVKENVPRNWQEISQVLLSGSTASLICSCQLVVGVLLDLAFLAMGFSGMGWCPALPVRSWYLAGKLWELGDKWHCNDAHFVQVS